MNKKYLFIAILTIITLVVITFVVLNTDKQEKPAAKKPSSQIEISTTCKSGADCKKYHACEKMICANNDQVNEKVSAQKLSNCDIDVTLYDPPGAFSRCECIKNNCQFATSQ